MLANGILIPLFKSGAVFLKVCKPTPPHIYVSTVAEELNPNNKYQLGNGSRNMILAIKDTIKDHIGIL
jgi:hypothetical protein